MAASNESQGLKIAVAVFVTLTVLMAVSTYFAYKAFTEADAKLTASESKLATANKAQSDALGQVEVLAKYIGSKSTEADAIKTERDNDYKKIDAEIKSIETQVDAAVAQAQAVGASGHELDEAKSKVRQLTNAYMADPNKNYMSSLARLTDLMKSLTALTTRMSFNYVDVKRGLEGANGVNAAKLAEVEKAFNEAKADLIGEQKKHVDEREILVKKVDEFAEDKAKLTTELAGTGAKLRQLEEDSAKKLALAQQTIREYRDRLERTETVMDRPDGVVTFVDYVRGEIHADIGRSKGARPQMQFAIFDSSSPGLPTDKPKGSVELIKVDDTKSIARIMKTISNIDPIKVGDYVYSAAWSPNEPMRFALIGRIDINRDGVDDRDDLKRMIEAAGGIVDYDLPPPEVGKESGKLTGKDAWYVVDDRIPLRELYGANQKPSTARESQEHAQRKSEVIREARLIGVRPMPIERLLPYHGYDYLAPIRGRAEAVDTASMKRLLAPRQEASKPKETETAPKEAEPAPK